MLPVLAACSTAAACDGADIGPPLWLLATAMVGIFVLLIGGAIAIGAVYRRKSLSVPAPTRPVPSPARSEAPWAHAARRRP